MAVVAVGHRPAVLPGHPPAVLPGAVVVVALPGAAVGQTGGVAVEEEVEVAVEARRMSQSLLIKYILGLLDRIVVHIDKGGDDQRGCIEVRR